VANASTGSTDSNARRRLAVAGAAAGVAASLLAYVLTYAVASGPVRNSLASTLVDFLTGDPQVWRLVGCVFYNAHFADAVVPGLLGGGNAVDFVAQSRALPGLLYVVPPLVLPAAGVGAGRAVGATDVGGGLRAGVAVTAGYLPLAAIGTVLFEVSAGDAAAGPDPVTAVLLAGVVYPVAFGGLGGAVAGRLPAGGSS
jgi:hypothetical protein